MQLVPVRIHVEYIELFFEILFYLFMYIFKLSSTWKFSGVILHVSGTHTPRYAIAPRYAIGACGISSDKKTNYISNCYTNKKK